MTRALAARCLALLGPIDGPVAVLGPQAARLAAALAGRIPLAGSGDLPAAAVVSFLGARGTPADRQRLLADLRARLGPGAPVILVDHNRPRSWWGRALGVAALALRGLPPARARYPAARELAVLGLGVERLRLARGERVQLIAARWHPCGPEPECVQGPERGPWR